MVDLSLRTMAADTLSLAWPAFLAFGGAQFAFARRVRRRGGPSLAWALAALATSLALWATLCVVSLTMSEGMTTEILASTGPTQPAFALAHVALRATPRSHPVVPLVTVVAGVALSWAVAIWLYRSPFPSPVLDVSQGPRVLGGVAALIGFLVSGALWAAMSGRRDLR
jgi:hypothetical protein